MSHFTKLERAQITDPEAFLQACDELGMTRLEAGQRLPGYSGNSMNVAHGATIGKYGVGLVERPDGKFDMVADWWGVRPAVKGRSFINDQDLQDFMLRTTTKNALVNTYKKQGFRAAVSEDAEQNLNVVLTRF